MKIGKDKRKKNQTGGVVKLVASGEASVLWAPSSTGRAERVSGCDII